MKLLSVVPRRFITKGFLSGHCTLNVLVFLFCCLLTICIWQAFLGNFYIYMLCDAWRLPYFWCRSCTHHGWNLGGNPQDNMACCSKYWLDQNYFAGTRFKMKRKGFQTPLNRDTMKVQKMSHSPIQRCKKSKRKKEITNWMCDVRGYIVYVVCTIIWCFSCCFNCC